MEKAWTKGLCCFFLLTFFFAGCKKFDGLDQIGVQGYQAEYAIPLFKGKANLQDLFSKLGAESYLTVGPNQQITFNYESNMSGQTSKEIFDLFSTFPPFPVDTFMAIPFHPPNNIDIDVLKLKQGTIIYTFESNIADAVTIELSIPQATKGGEIFKKIIDVNYRGENLPIVVPPTSIDIKGYTIIPRNDSIFVQYTALTPQGQRVTMDEFGMVIRDLEFTYAEGYMGNEIIDLKGESLQVDFFDNWTQGNITFEDPRIKLVIENSFGFPIHIQPRFIKVISREGEVIPLESPFIDSGIDIEYPRLYEPGQSRITSFVFNPSNSNIKEILAAGPVSIDYDLDAIPNPQGNTSLTGFMTDQSQFTIQLQLQLPIFGTANGFVTQDTFDVDLSEYENVDFAEFKLTTENELPLEVAMQMYFADENGQILDSLFAAQAVILAAAPVDEQGLVSGVSEKFTAIPKTAQEFEQLKTAKKLFLRAAFQTSQDGAISVRIRSTQDVNLKMGMKLGYRN